MRLEDAYPRRYGNPVDLRPLVFASFNQRIDKNDLLKHLKLKVWDKTFAIRLATAVEIEKDDNVRPLAKSAEDDRWIAIKPVADLPEASTVKIVIPAGTPGDEGPLRTEKDQQRAFKTRGPMKLQRLRCGWSRACPPFAAWSVRFSNAIDEESFDEGFVQIKPFLPQMKVDFYGRHMTIRGESRGNTTYTVSFDGRLKDEFGQSLVQPAKREVRVSSAEPFLFREQDAMAILDPAFGPKLSIFSVNQSRLRVKLYKVEPRDWTTYEKFRRAYDWEGRVTRPPGASFPPKRFFPKASLML